MSHDITYCGNQACLSGARCRRSLEHLTLSPSASISVDHFMPDPYTGICKMFYPMPKVEPDTFVCRRCGRTLHVEHESAHCAFVCARCNDARRKKISAVWADNGEVKK